MTALLGFLLECAATAALLGMGTSALVLALALVLRPGLSRLRPSTRADLVFLGGVLPAVVAIIGTMAAAFPPVASALGLMADHCLRHGHHLHICIVHGPSLHADIALIGAATLAASVVRGGLWCRRLLEAARDVRELERLGTVTAVAAAFPVIEIPGASRLCHALGAFRRRILLSQRLSSALSPDALRCALAHESAHLSRRDPLANAILSFAGLFVLPVVARLFQRAYRVAAEHACDDEAAADAGDGLAVAEALLAVAALQHGAPQPVRAGAMLGFGQHSLQTRVERLIALGAEPPRAAHALVTAAMLSLAALVLALQQATVLHHAVETVLHGLF